MIKPFVAYALYNAIKLHFGGKYDAIKYQYKTSVTEKSYWKRKDKYFFAQAAKKFDDAPDLVDYYVSHFIKGKAWIGEIVKDDQVYKDWQKRIESLGYNFEQDLRYLEEKYGEFDKLFEKGEESFPPILQEYLSEEIMLETITIFEQMFGITDRFDKEITDTIIWPDINMRVKKYAPFLITDSDRMKKIVRKVFTS